MKSKTKVLILISATLCFFMVGSVVVRNSFFRREGTDTLSEVKGIIDYSTYPSIQNLPPTSVVEGNSYVYELAVIDSDTHFANIKLGIVEGPSWLTSTDLTIIGNPKSINIGTHKVVLKLSDGEHDVYDTFYIVVLSKDEIE